MCAATIAKKTSYIIANYWVDINVGKPNIILSIVEKKIAQPRKLLQVQYLEELEHQKDAWNYCFLWMFIGSIYDPHFYGIFQQDIQQI